MLNTKSLKKCFMKKSFIGLVILLTLSTSALRANGIEPVSAKVLASFQKEFAQAANVSWTPEKEKNLYHARFLYNDETMEAFFNEDGTLLAIARLISERQLPILITKALAADYSGYSIRQVVEFTNEGETSYIVNVYNTKETEVLKFFPNGDSQRIKRIKNKF
jgi:hypothetical protein